MQVSWTDEQGRKWVTTDRHPAWKAYLAKQEQIRMLKNVEISRVDLVERGANPGSTVAFFKAEDVEEVEKAEAGSAATGDTGTAAGIGTQSSPPLPTQAVTTPVATLDGGRMPTDADTGEGQSANIGPGPDPLGEIRDRLDRLVRQGAITQAQASEMYTKQRLAMAPPATSGETAWTQSDSIGIGKGYLSPEAAKENVSRSVSELEVRKALRARDRRSALPLTKTQGLLIAARTMAGMSQADAARATGFSKSLLSMVESGQAPVSGSLALQLAEAYGLEGADGLQWAREVSRSKPEA